MGFLKEWVDPINETNSTEQGVFLTEEWVEDQAAEHHGTGTSSADFKDREENYFYLARGTEPVDAIKIEGYTSTTNDGMTTFAFRTPTGEVVTVTK